jgi:hypothetical protein
MLWNPECLYPNGRALTATEKCKVAALEKSCR